jgi:hypothetical protein
MADNDENVVGSASVRVTADLTDFNAGLAKAKAATQAFDTQASTGFKNVAQALEGLNQRQRQLMEGLLAANATEREAQALLGRTAEGQKLAATYAQLRAQAAKEAAQADVAGAQSAAQAAQTRLAMDRAAVEQLRTRMGLTRQMFGDETASATAAAKAQEAIAASTLAFRMRTAKQWSAAEKAAAAEVAAAAAAGERAAVKEAESTLALRRRITAQRIQEETQTARQRETLLRQTTPMYRAESQRDTTIGTANRLRDSGAISDAEHAAAIAGATAQYEKMVGAAEKAAEATGHVRTGTAGVVSEILVLGREFVRGNFSRAAGSLSILGDRLGILPALLNPVALGFIAVGTAIAGATATGVLYEEQQRRIQNIAGGAGLRSGASFSDITTEAQRSATGSGQAYSQTLDVIEAMAKAGVQGEQTRESIGALLATYARLNDEKPAKAQEDIARAMLLTRDGVKGANEALEILVKTGANYTGAQMDQIRAAAAANDILQVQNLLWQGVTRHIDDATKAGIGQANWLDKAISWWKGLGDQIGYASANFAYYTELANADPATRAKLISERAGQQRAKDQATNRLAQQGGATNDQLYATQLYLQSPAGEDEQSYQDAKQKRAAVAKAVADDQAAARASPSAAASQRLARDLQLQAAYNDTVARYVPLAQRKAEIDEKQGQLAIARRGHDAARVRQLEQEIVGLQAGTRVVSNADLAQEARGAGDRAADRVRPDRSAISETNSVAAKNADATAELALAAAYEQGRGPALIAEAQRKAVTEATRKGKAETDALRQAELNLATATAAKDAAKEIADLEAKTKAQAAYNDQVAKGEITRAQASRRAEQDVQSGNLQSIANSATGPARTALQALIARQASAADAANDQADTAELVDKVRKQQDELDAIRAKIANVGKPKGEQDIAAARLAATQDIGTHTAATALGKTFVDNAGQKAALDNALAAANANKELTKTVTDEIEKLNTLRATMGQTYQEVARYTEYQKLLDEAKQKGIPLDDAERQKLQQLAQGYAQASEQIRLLTEKQNAAKTAAQSLAETFAGGIESMLYSGEKFNQVAAQISRSLGKEALEGVLTGGGPFAGLLGTAQGSGPNSANGGLLSGLFGAALGVGGAGGQRKGQSASDALYVTVAAGASYGNDGSYAAGFGALSSMVDPALGGLAAGGGTGPGTGGAESAPQATGYQGQSPLALGVQNAMRSGATMLGNTIAGGVQSIGQFFHLFPTQPAMPPIGADMAGLFHEGTSYVGTPARMIPVNPQLFATAPRLHSGLAPDEFPAILQKGERVTSKSGQSGAGGNLTVNMHITTPDTTSFGRSSNQMVRETKRQFGRVK